MTDAELTDPADEIEPPAHPADLTDAADLELDELRALRRELQLDDDAISYARRIAQARLDLVAAETDRRSSGADAVARADELRTVLSNQLTGGPARPPRPAEDLSDHPLAVELDTICSSHGFGRLPSLGVGELGALAEAIGAFESDVSARRRALFARLDALSAELVRRYRVGEADVAGLHSPAD